MSERVCTSIFLAKTAHLQDTDFVQIDRPILEVIGFKNCFVEQKDKNGNVKLDKNDQPKLKDTRTDFNHAIRCLRNMEGFKESNNFDDDAHFVIKKTTSKQTHGAGGQNKQSLWIRKNMFLKWSEQVQFIIQKRKYVGKGSVYFIHEDEKFDRFKIGYAEKDIAGRLAALQIGNPDLLVVYRTIENVPAKTEKQLHRFFHKYRIRGEWFAITPDMIDDAIGKL